MRFLHIIIFLSVTCQCFSNGIIIADEQKQTQLFSSKDSTQIIKYAETISSQFNRMILHLGKDFVFRKGNIYTSEISRRNLSLFCKTLSKQKTEVILWFFDSYGAENFIALYKNHKEIIDENIAELTKMKIPFDGIAVDLEWINLHNFENNDRFAEVLQYLKNKTSDKKIYYFTSLIDKPEENIKRGYNIDKLNKIPASPITMLYIKDGGFRLHKNTVHPHLNDTRIKELVKYYKKNKWDFAFSLENAIVQIKADKSEILKISSADSLMNKVKKLKTHNSKYFSVTDYEITENYTCKLKTGNLHTFTKNDRVYFFRHTGKVPDSNCFLWEYFSIQAANSEKSK